MNNIYNVFGIKKNPEGSNVYSKAGATNVTPQGVIFTGLCLFYRDAIPSGLRLRLKRQGAGVCNFK